VTSKPTLQAVRGDLEKLANRDKAKVLGRFFKTGPGKYGEGDVFLGVSVPDLRRLAKTHRDVHIDDVGLLLRSPVHEERLLALFLLIDRYSRGGEPEKRKIYEFYLRNAKYVNNWDLVDLSAPHIAGDYLVDRDRNALYDLARSKNLWERRIAIIATNRFIRRGEFSDTIEIAKMLLFDEQDLIHKAVGWMLREVGKRDREAEERFLRKHYRRMPRTMLRYAIEKFPERRRQSYLKGRV
jgi:3-methyladenine DNA glycosylase AlkD